MHKTQILPERKWQKMVNKKNPNEEIYFIFTINPNVFKDVTTVNKFIPRADVGHFQHNKGEAKICKLEIIQCCCNKRKC